MEKRILSAMAVVVAATGAVVTVVKRTNKKGVFQEGKEMSESKLKKANEKITEGYKKIEDGVVAGYKKIENGVVGGYKTIEGNVVGVYKKVEDKFVDSFLKHGGESIENAKKRLKSNR